MSLRYFKDNEYEQAFFEFGNMRSKIAEIMRNLSSLEGITILDLLSGHGLLSAETAKRFSKSRIIGLGLRNDVEAWKTVRESERYESKIWLKFHYLLADAVNIPLKTSSCDMIVNFLGLEDLHMTSGLTGLKKLVDEIDRITKDDALIQISLVEYGDTPEERVAQEIWREIGLDAIFLERSDYLRMFESINIHPLEEYKLELGRKMTTSQTKEELRFACEEAPKIFSDFGVEAADFDELWEKFRDRIEEHGFASWSQVKVIILSKGRGVSSDLVHQ